MGSTNELARQLAGEGASHGTVVLADSQESGRGRLGRQWSSPAGLNIYMSVILKPGEAPCLISSPGLIPLAAGLASLDAISESCGYKGISLKWPNDLMAGDRKLGGILLEARSRAGKTGHAVLGIGINVNSSVEDFPPELRGYATSLMIETGRTHETEGIVRALAEALDRTLGMLEVPDGAVTMLKAYSKACQSMGRTVRAETGEGTITGRAVDIDPLGRLMIEGDDGQSASLSSADLVHLR